MIVEWQEQLRPGVALREIVQQATTALISMDAKRLEELAKCCADLNREIESSGEIAEAALALRDAENDVKLLGCVLYETRANLTVLSRLHAIRLREAGALRRRFADGHAPYAVETVAGLNGMERTVDYGDN
jgi:hypothetical protein